MEDVVSFCFDLLTCERMYDGVITGAEFMEDDPPKRLPVLTLSRESLFLRVSSKMAETGEIGLVATDLEEDFDWN